MKLMKLNLVQRGLAEYKYGLLSLLDIIFWAHGGNCCPPPLLVDPFPLPIIIPRRDRRPALYSANPLCTRLCFIRFMSAHPPPNKDKDKEEDEEDDLILLINSAKFDIGRATEVGSLIVGK